jgi:outer membrane protein assembly factor BamB
MTLSEKDINIMKGISQVAGIFTLIIAITMIFSLVQLKTINPLDNPALLAVKDQYDKDPENAEKAEQVRAMDLMARKAYFASRRQVETGSYLLLAGAIIFVLCQQLISGNEKVMPAVPGVKPDLQTGRKKKRNYLLASVTVITFAAVVSSFMLRSGLPDLAAKEPGKEADERKISKRAASSFKPDKTNYPYFRGQDSRGIAGGSGYPTEWNGESGTNIKWKIRIPKAGKSSPVIWGEKLFVTGAEAKTCEVYCIDKNTGEVIWSASASGIPGEPSELPEMDQDAGLAVSTVAANSKAVCAIFANGNLVCLDHDGKQKWVTNLGVPKNSYGYSSSLIIFEDLLIVQFDSNEKISLMGFDISTGELKWETIRRGRPAWSSPVIGNFSGEPQVIINGNPYVTGFDPVTGKELWAVECMSGDVAPSVAVNGTLVYAVTDYAKLAAIKPGSAASIIWEDNIFTSDVSSPVATDDFLFISTGNGDVACYNALKGDTLWTHYFMDQFYASPVIADEKVYLLDRSGVMHIVRATESYELIAESPLGEFADCTPAFSDKRIYIRSKNNLYCISE